MRRYEDELKFLEQISPVEWRIKKGFVPGMNVDGSFYLDSSLFELQMEELQQHSKAGGVGGFLPAVKQIANVAALPGIVRRSVAMPDCHSGYGFAIGNVAAFDMDDPTAVVSPVSGISITRSKLELPAAGTATATPPTVFPYTLLAFAGRRRLRHQLRRACHPHQPH